MRVNQSLVHNTHETGFVTIELPFVLSGFIAVIGVGACLWYKNGHVTTGAWVGFALAIPFVLLTAAILVTWWIEEKRRKRGGDAG